MTDHCDFCNRECHLVNDQLRGEFPHLFKDGVYLGSTLGREADPFMRAWGRIVRANPPLLTGLFKDYGTMGVGVICALSEGTVE